jgi:hypothetical protein
MGPRPLRIGPADDNEFLTVEAFGLALVAGIPGLQFNDHETGDGELSSNLVRVRSRIRLNAGLAI